MITLIVILVVLVLMSVILAVPVLLIFDINADGKNIDSRVTLKYGFFKIVLHPKNKSAKNQIKNKKEKSKLTFEDAKGIYRRIKNIYRECKEDIADILGYAALKSVTLDKLKTNIKFDFENPMNTGIATGAVNAAVYNVYALLDNTVSIKEKSVDIEPLFYNTRYFKAGVFGIVRLKNVHIMVMLIKLIKVYFKIRKIK